MNRSISIENRFDFWHGSFREGTKVTFFSGATAFEVVLSNLFHKLKYRNLKIE